MTALSNILLKVESIDTMFKAMVEKIDGLEFKLDQMNEKLDAVAKQQTSINRNTPNLKKIKKEKRAGEPKRNISAFFHFCAEKRPEIKKTNPTASTPEMTKLMSVQWRELKSKAKYDGIAADDKVRFTKEMAAFEADLAAKTVS